MRTVAGEPEDSLEEQRAVRDAAGVIDWSTRGKIHVAGEDRLTFLDGLLTNDMKTLDRGHGLYAATLDHKGRIHGDMIVYNAGDHYLLETEDKEALLGYLSKLLVSDDVTLTDASDRFALFSVFGPRARSIVSGIVGGALPSLPYEHRVSGAVRVARTPYFGGEGYELWVPIESNPRALWQRLVESGARPLGTDAAEALRIEVGRPRFGVDMDEDTLALEARLDEAISLTKGCYVGQEVVSRATYVGQVKRLLVGLEIGGMEPPARGISILARGLEIGRITSAARSADRGILALGYVRREHAEPGTEVIVGPLGIPGRVRSLPPLKA